MNDRIYSCLIILTLLIIVIFGVGVEIARGIAWIRWALS